MSPKRGDRAAPPAIGSEWHIKFRTNDAAKGWEELGRSAPSNTRQAFETMRGDPQPRNATDRCHRLRGRMACDTLGGRKLEQWQIEVTSSGRIWYLVDDEKHTVWVVYASAQHPKPTE